MNIALNSFYLPSIDKIGVGYQAHYMGNALVRRGHRVVMYSPAPPCNDASYEHVQVDAGRRFRLHGFATAMGKVDLGGFDVLHSHGEDHLIRRRAVPCHVRTVHGSGLQEAVNIPGAGQKTRMLYIAVAEMAASVSADCCVAVSANTTRSYPWIRHVIPNGVDLSAFHPGMKEPTPTILFVGTYQNRKRGRLLMDQFQEMIRPALPGARLWMVCGDAPQAPGVTVLGRVPLEQLVDLYRRAWVFCLPSSYEGFGVPYIEAMASGTAVVATPNPGAREVLGDGRFGVVVEPDQVGAAILRVLREDRERERLEKTGLARAEEFAWDRIMERYERLYHQVITKQSCRPVTGLPRS